MPSRSDLDTFSRRSSPAAFDRNTPPRRTALGMAPPTSLQQMYCMPIHVDLDCEIITPNVFIVYITFLLSRRSSTFYLLLLSLFRPWLSRQWISAAPQRIATKFAHNIGVVPRLITYFRFFSPDPYKFGEGKTQFPRTTVNWNRITSKRLNVSTNEYQIFHLG